MMKMVSKAKKQLLANQLNKLLFDTHEDALKKAVSRFFRKLEKNLIKEVEVYWENLMYKGQFDLMLSPIHEAQEEYHDLILEYTLAEFNRGVKQGDRLVSRAIEQYVMKADRNVGAFYEKGDDLFATSQFAEDRLRDTVFQASDKTMARVDESINEILTQGYKEGWGVKDVRNRLMTRFDQLKDWEANRIARTEMQHAHNLGIMHSYEQNNVQHIQWRSAVNQPMRTRPSHIALNGEIIRVGDRFSNGLQFPGDKTGKIEEWINCRCSCPPYILPPGMSAPSYLSQFREGDLVPVGQSNHDYLLRKETGGRIGWEQYRQVMQGKSLEELGILLQQQKQEEQKPIEPVRNPKDNMYTKYNYEIQIKGLETLKTFKETIKSDNKKLYNTCKRHDCFDEVYNLLSHSQVSEFNLKEVQLIDIYQKFRKEDLKEYIQMLDPDFFSEIDGWDISWKKFCKEFDLLNEHTGEIDDEKVLHAVCEGINESGYSLCYALDSKSKNKHGGKTLMLAIDF